MKKSEESLENQCCILRILYCRTSRVERPDHTPHARGEIADRCLELLGGRLRWNSELSVGNYRYPTEKRKREPYGRSE